MYVCMYIYIYIHCICICVYIYIYIYTHMLYLYLLIFSYFFKTIKPSLYWPRGRHSVFARNPRRFRGRVSKIAARDRQRRRISFLQEPRRPVVDSFEAGRASTRAVKMSEAAARRCHEGGAADLQAGPAQTRLFQGLCHFPSDPGARTVTSRLYMATCIYFPSHV